MDAKLSFVSLIVSSQQRVLNSMIVFPQDLQCITIPLFPVSLLILHIPTA